MAALLDLKLASTDLFGSFFSFWHFESSDLLHGVRSIHCTTTFTLISFFILVFTRKALWDDGHGPRIWRHVRWENATIYVPPLGGVEKAVCT